MRYEFNCCLQLFKGLNLACFVCCWCFCQDEYYPDTLKSTQILITCVELSQSISSDKPENVQYTGKDFL